MRDPRVVKLFLSCPGDVADKEGRAAWDIIQRINRNFRRWIRFDVIFYLEAGIAMPAHENPQITIERELGKSVECDVVVGIFWARMGTKLPVKAFQNPFTGKQCLSGSEHEVLSALAQSIETGGKPLTLVYRRTQAFRIDPDAKKALEQVDQWKLVQDFFSTNFGTDANGALTRAYNQHNDPEHFAQIFEMALCDYIGQLLTETTDPQE